jgi:hypothetical protein
MIRRSIQLCAVAFLLSVATAGLALMPTMMNYQVMLTDDADNPLANQSVQLEFRIFDQEAGGSPLWTEVQNVTTNSIGVASLVLGSVNPMGFWTFDPTWLEVRVNDQLMEPRRPLAGAPYSKVAPEAYHAVDADHAADSDALGSIEAAAYALDDDLYQPGTLNDPTNPLEWTKLKNMPSGFADGTDNTGPADGSSLDASDGNPVDVVRVDADGKTFVGVATPDETHAAELNVTVSGTRIPGMFDTDSFYSNVPAVFARSSASLGVLGNAVMEGYTMAWPSYAAGVAGVGEDDGYGGFFAALGTGKGTYTYAGGGGPALHSLAVESSYSGLFEGGSGVRMETDYTIPVLRVQNTRTSGYGDALYVTAGSGGGPLTWALNVGTTDGIAGRFTKTTVDGEYAVRIYSPSGTSPGLYVSGYIQSTSFLAQSVETSRGREAVYGVTSNDVEVISSGEGRLTSGSARVDFDRLFAESIAGASGLRITATPIGSWSALYVEGVDASGFNLRSGDGDMDVAFNWVAVGRAKGAERRPDVMIPDPEQEARAAAEKRAEFERTRPPRAERPEIMTVETGAGEVLVPVK